MRAQTHTRRNRTELLAFTQKRTQIILKYTGQVKYVLTDIQLREEVREKKNNWMFMHVCECMQTYTHTHTKYTLVNTYEDY